MKIIFVRHGSTSANEQHLYCGGTNPGLSVAGQQQARNAARLLKGRSIDVWLCGTSGRTGETAGIIFDELVLSRDIIRFMPDIREINFGLFENYSYDEINYKFPVECADYLVNWRNYTFPEGDNTRQYFEYCARSFQNILREYKGKDICIIGHKGYIASVMCALKNYDIDRLFDINIGCGEIIETEIVPLEAD